MSGARRQEKGINSCWFSYCWIKMPTQRGAGKAKKAARNRSLSTRATSSPFRKASFFKQVYQVVRTIPPGKVLTYGQIATILGSPFMARQVGWAMHGCPPSLPWQRVVGRGGKILINSLSLGEGPILQRRSLEMEGVKFVRDRVDMEVHQFKPKTRSSKSRTGR